MNFVVQSSVSQQWKLLYERNQSCHIYMSFKASKNTVQRDRDIGLQLYNNVGQEKNNCHPEINVQITPEICGCILLRTCKIPNTHLSRKIAVCVSRVRPQSSNNINHIFSKQNILSVRYSLEGKLHLTKVGEP